MMYGGSFNNVHMLQEVESSRSKLKNIKQRKGTLQAEVRYVAHFPIEMYSASLGSIIGHDMKRVAFNFFFW